ncbi:hypothetical protein ABZ611_06305 [Streptomyces sp. NPDC007861]|uniref:hypothetical protein n=1 Tax=Streptomyces sp. NPDC007861 TaxID=3154893 RepID=UPI0033D3DDD1
MLNVPPDRRGLVDGSDRTRLLEFTVELSRRFGRPHSTELTPVAGEGFVARFPEPVPIDHLELCEELSSGQRIAGHTVLADNRVIASGGTVGVRRVHAFQPVVVSELTIRLTGEGDTALRAVTGFRTGSGEVPSLEEQPEVMAEKFAATAVAASHGEPGTPR